MKAEIDKGRPNIVRVLAGENESRQLIALKNMIEFAGVSAEYTYTASEESILYDINKFSEKIQESIDIGAIKVRALQPLADVIDDDMTMTTTQNKCKDCMFEDSSDKAQNRLYLWCNRYPKSMQVSSEHWCGEWRPK
ncbi:hypothetical protein GQ472_00695 [archaeon]|nr:hypothetical protein [archaeon]